MLWAIGLWGTMLAAVNHPGTSGEAVSAPTPEWATVLNWDVKVRPQMEVAGARSADLIAARGECESFQLYAKPPLKSVNAKERALTGAGPAIHLRVYREEFIDAPYPSNSQGATGLWPDALIPVEDYYVQEQRNGLPHASTAERPLVLYVEICVPERQAAGVYTGGLELSLDGKPGGSIPVRLEVLPFTLPATASLPTAFGLFQHAIAKGHHLSRDSDEARALVKEYAIALLRHRVSPYGLSMISPEVKVQDNEVSVDFSRYDRELQAFLEGAGMPNGARFTSAEIREPPKSFSDDQRVQYYRKYREHFAQRGWKAQLFYYAKDEPKPDDFPLVKQQSARVRKAGGIPVLVTSAVEDLISSADIICPVLNCFFERPGSKTCVKVRTTQQLRAEMAPGSKIWWYQSCMSHGCGGPKPGKEPRNDQAYTGWASYMMDHPATLNRAMGTLAFLNDIDGELYWDTTYMYQKSDDPWAGIFEFGGNGDGTLFYPGLPSKVGGKHHIPIESLRLKLIRDGLEDYEYFRLLAKADPEQAKTLAKKLARSGYQITSDAAVWNEVRAKVAQALKRGERPAPAQ